VIVDTSAWVAFIGGIDGAPSRAVRRAVDQGVAMTTDVIRLEVLAGARGGATVATLGAMLDGCRQLDQEPRTDVEAAATLYRACRRAGETIRSLNDCLIAAIAIRNDVPVLCEHRDFDAIARHSDLQVVSR
jgi:predicted nucleic acid-binding protein